MEVIFRIKKYPLLAVTAIVKVIELVYCKRHLSDPHTVIIMHPKIH